MRTLFALLPEVLVVAAALAVLLERPLRLRRYGWLPLGVAAVVLVALGWELVEGVRVAVLFHGGVVQDRFALFAKAGLLAAAFLTLLATEWAPGSRPMAGLTLLTCFGGMVAASATDLAGLWAGLALAVLAAVATAAIRDGPFAARPVLVLGGGLVALVLVGFVLAYAAAGSTTLAGLASGLRPPLGLPLAIGLLLAVGGLLALLAAAGSLGPLAAGAAALVLLKFVGAAAHDATAWSVLAPVAGALMMLAGALRALAGTGRVASALLTQAGAVQLGWFMTASAAPDRQGEAAALVLLGGWLLASAAGTAALGDLPYGLDGLAERGPARALAFTACVLSLAGVPPLAGFFGEFAVASQLARLGYFWVITVGMFCSAMVLVAVVRDLRLAWLTSPAEHVPRLRHAWAPFGGALVAAVGVSAYGIFAYPISALALQGARAIGLP
jgi:NADH-quinone oxidoreductase subunit N